MYELFDLQNKPKPNSQAQHERILYLRTFIGSFRKKTGDGEWHWAQINRLPSQKQDQLKAIIDKCSGNSYSNDIWINQDLEECLQLIPYDPRKNNLIEDHKMGGAETQKGQRRNKPKQNPKVLFHTNEQFSIEAAQRFLFDTREGKLKRQGRFQRPNCSQIQTIEQPKSKRKTRKQRNDKQQSLSFHSMEEEINQNSGRKCSSKNVHRKGKTKISPTSPLSKSHLRRLDQQDVPFDQSIQKIEQEQSPVKNYQKKTDGKVQDIKLGKNKDQKNKAKVQDYFHQVNLIKTLSTFNTLNGENKIESSAGNYSMKKKDDKTEEQSLKYYQGKTEKNMSKKEIKRLQRKQRRGKKNARQKKSKEDQKIQSTKNQKYDQTSICIRKNQESQDISQRQNGGPSQIYYLQRGIVSFCKQERVQNGEIQEGLEKHKEEPHYQPKLQPQKMHEQGQNQDPGLFDIMSLLNNAANDQLNHNVVNFKMELGLFQIIIQDSPSEKIQTIPYLQFMY